MTINKSQGQSFNHVAVDLRSHAFTHGQFYVAMSRVTVVREVAILLDSVLRSDAPSTVDTAQSSRRRD